MNGATFLDDTTAARTNQLHQFLGSLFELLQAQLAVFLATKVGTLAFAALVKG